MARFPLVPTAPEPERAILVGVEWRDNAWRLNRSLDELERLAHTAGAQCVSRLSQRLVKPYPKSFIGILKKIGGFEGLKFLISIERRYGTFVNPGGFICYLPALMLLATSLRAMTTATVTSSATPAWKLW